MSSFWMVILVLAFIALAVAFVMFILGLLCANKDMFVGVIVFLTFGIMFGAAALSEEVTDKQEVPFIVTHMDIVRNKYDTDYKIAIKSEDGSLSKVMDVTEEEYATTQVGDTLIYDVTWYKNNIGEEGYHILIPST